MLISLILREFDLSLYGSGGGRKGRRDGREWIRGRVVRGGEGWEGWEGSG